MLPWNRVEAEVVKAMQKTRSKGIKTAAAFAFVPPIAAFLLIYVSVLLREHLASAYGIGGPGIPDGYDVAKRILAVMPFLLSMYGIVNGLIFVRTKPFKFLSLLRILLSIYALFASVLYWPH